MSGVAYPAYSILAIIASVLVLVPLPWHFQAWNAGTCLFMIYTSMSCLNFGINSIVWSSDAINRSPIWCDISSRIVVASAVAIPISSLCINRRLYKIATSQAVSISYEQKRRAVIVDLSIGIGVPMIQLVMQYIVSGHRFDIFQDLGCFPFTYNVTLAYPLVMTWPAIIGCMSAVYCGLTLRAFLKRRAQFNEFMSSNTSLNASRYFRLMGLATTELMCTTPLAIYTLVLDGLTAKVQPWISWEDTHFRYSMVNQYPSGIWRANKQLLFGLEFTRWAPVFCAVVFFSFFGFASEARRNYKRVLDTITKRIPCPKFLSKLRISKLSQRPRHDILPAYTPKFSPLSSSKTIATFIDSKGISSTKSSSYEFDTIPVELLPATPSSFSSDSFSHIVTHPEKVYPHDQV